MSRILIETMVKRTLRDIEEDPERNVRNLVDMALQFSKGRFQKRLLEVIQEMLKNENSAYYKLVRDVVTNVDHDRLLTFGMNIGYNSCTAGAKKIREWETKTGYNVPWVICLELESELSLKYSGCYERLISQGEQIGVFTWILFMNESLEEVLMLVEEHPDSAFIILGSADKFTERFLEQIESFQNVMLLVKYNQYADDLCKSFRDKKLLYGVYYCYKQEEIESIENGELFCDIQTLHPAAAVLMPAEKYAAELQEYVYQILLDTRQSQKYPTLIWDLYGDNCFVDEIISADSCFLFIDKNGCLCDRNIETVRKQVLCNQSLQQILSENFQKK